MDDIYFDCPRCGMELTLRLKVTKTVVDKQRLEALERLYEAAQMWRAGMVDRYGPTTSDQERRGVHEYNVRATRLLAQAVDELEALEHRCAT